MTSPCPNTIPEVAGPLRLAIVGEAPGDREVEARRPFVGPSGKLLSDLLDTVRVPRSGCFIGNVYQWQPPYNIIEKVDRSTPEWKYSVDTLISELRAFKPTVTIACGNTPLEVLCSRHKITKWRGSILFSSYPEIGKVIPTLHPAAVLRQWPWYRTVLMDFERAVEEATHPNQPLPQRSFHICHSFQDAIGLLRSLEVGDGWIAFDIESITLTNEITCIGFATSADSAFVVPFGDWPVHEEAQLRRAVERVLVGPRPKIAQNAAFDIGMLITQWGIVVENLVMDTMLAQHSCYPELPKSLAFLCSMYTREPYYKWEAKRTAAEGDGEDDEAAWGTSVPKDQLYAYNAKDCCVTFEVANCLAKEISEVGAELAFRSNMEQLPLAIEATVRGILIDQGVAARRLGDLETEISAVGRTAKEAFGRVVNTKSPKDMKALLYDELHLPVQKTRPKRRGEEGSITTNEDALLELARQTQGKDFDIMILLKQRQLRTKTSFYKLDLYKDGRLHANKKVGGTETRRWSSSSSYLGGRNDMNIPEDCRDQFVADPGKTLVGFDLAAAEARVVAYKSYICTGNDLYKKIIDGPTKIHIWFGLQLIDRGICPQTKDYFLAHASNENEWYYLSKVSVHGFSYDLGELKWCRKVASETDGKVIIQVSTAKTIKHTLYEVISSIPAWHAAVQEHLSHDRTMISSFGGVRTFFERWGHDLWGEAYAHEPQTTVADYLGKGLLAFTKAFPEFEFLHYNYDSVYGQVPNDRVDAALECMKPLVQFPFKVWNFERTRSVELILPASFKSGHSWKDLK